jgi:hypothetical protein
MKSQQTANTDTSSSSDSIGEALGLTPMTSMPPPAPIQTTDPSQIEDDYEYARGNIIATIEKGREALDGILDVAGMGQHPRAFEVAANLVKTMVDANKDLMNLAKQKKELDKIDGKGAAQTVNNNLFVGSTAELLKALKNNNIKDIEQ